MRGNHTRKLSCNSYNMNKIRQIKELNKRELEAGVSTSASWHNDYRDTAFIYIGGLPLELTEGDVVTIFSQYGEPMYINLVRDKETGKSKGFCFLKYEDQRSADLAVDNLGGATLMGRMLNVDHTHYKKRDDEEIVDNTHGPKDIDEAADTDNEADSKRSRRRRSESEERPMLKEEQELARLQRDHDDDDPMKQFLIEEKQEEVKAAVAEYERMKKKQKREVEKSHKHRHHRSRRHEDGERSDRHRRRSGSGSQARSPRRRRNDERDSPAYQEDRRPRRRD